jgi:hypothetical protein
MQQSLKLPENDLEDVISPTPENRQEQPSDRTSIAAQEMALRAIQDDFQESKSRMQLKIAETQAQDRWLFRALLLTGSFSVLLILIGAYWFFAKDMKVEAALSGLVGILSGSGTAIFRGLQRQVKAKSEKLESQEEQQTQYLRAIQAAFTLTGPERDKQMAETAKWIREGVKRVSVTAQQDVSPDVPASTTSSLQSPLSKID